MPPIADHSAASARAPDSADEATDKIVIEYDTAAQAEPAMLWVSMMDASCGRDRKAARLLCRLVEAEGN